MAAEQIEPPEFESLGPTYGPMVGDVPYGQADVAHRPFAAASRLPRPAVLVPIYDHDGVGGESLPVGADIRPAAGDGERREDGREKVIRPATIADLDALVDIELGAFADVYGKPPADNADQTEVDAYQHTRQVVADKYRERLEMLQPPGGMIMVVERTEPDPNAAPYGAAGRRSEIYGMLVWCRTNQGPEAFLANGEAPRDMTLNSDIRDVYDPNGENGYVVNLAARPGRHNAGAGYDLMMEALQLGNELGLKRAFFESRMPTFAAWYEERRRIAAANGHPFDDTPIVQDAFAQEYSQQTRPDGTPLDWLLRYYVRNVPFATRLGLIRNAWQTDKPSVGYGVLFEVKLAAGMAEDEAQRHIAETTEAEASARHEVEEALAMNHAVQARHRGVGKRVLEFIWRHRGEAALVGSAAVAAAILYGTGQDQAFIQQVQSVEARPWLERWRDGFAAYVATGAAFLASSGAYTVARTAARLPILRDRIPEGFWRRWQKLNGGLLAVNTTAALVSAGLAVGAIANGVPEGPAQVSLYAGVAADAYVTVSSRAVIRRLFSGLFPGRRVRRQPQKA